MPWRRYLLTPNHPSFKSHLASYRMVATLTLGMEMTDPMARCTTLESSAADTSLGWHQGRQRKTEQFSGAHVTSRVDGNRRNPPPPHMFAPSVLSLRTRLVVKRQLLLGPEVWLPVEAGSVMDQFSSQLHKRKPTLLTRRRQCRKRRLRWPLQWRWTWTRPCLRFPPGLPPDQRRPLEWVGIGINIHLSGSNRRKHPNQIRKKKKSGPIFPATAAAAAPETPETQTSNSGVLRPLSGHWLGPAAWMPARSARKDRNSSPIIISMRSTVASVLPRRRSSRPTAASSASNFSSTVVMFSRLICLPVSRFR